MDKAIPETVIVKKSKFGKGIFSTADLPKNTILFKITGTPLNFQQTLLLGNNECYSLQTGIDKYIIPDHPFHMSNHCCKPNSAIDNHMNFFTLRDLKAGEELCWDYSTSMLEKHWTMKCNCGCLECRDIITDFDLLPPDLQNKYLNLKIVMPFIAEYIRSNAIVLPDHPIMSYSY